MPDLLPYVVGDPCVAIINLIPTTPAIVFAKGVTNPVRSGAVGDVTLTLDNNQSFLTSDRFVIHGNRYINGVAASGGWFTVQIVSATQMRIRVYDNNGLLDCLFSFRLRRY